jgi:adenine/guanine/hypoxanthine permease
LGPSRPADSRADGIARAPFATIIVMPVTYSIANGVGVGILLQTFGEILNRRRVSPLLVVFSGFFVWFFLHGTV